MSARLAARQLLPRLEAAGVPDAAMEAEVLVRSAAGMARAAYFAGETLPSGCEPRLETMVARREAREPAAYITGTRAFYGLELSVGPGVLIPRPETELLVEAGLLEAARLDAPIVVDVGTGSGAVAVAVAHALPAGSGGRVLGTDVSADALRVAATNRDSHGVELTLLRMDLLGGIGRADVVLANLPYIPSGEVDALEPEVSRWEPRVALDGGADGLALIRRLIDDCRERLRPALLALEVGCGQADAVGAYATECGAVVQVLRDLSGIERVVCARWA
ncbi:MAG: peptide chain release factor N(5)-glutamine methyltransferase [Tepidiformaceae bacterium]